MLVGFMRAQRCLRHLNVAGLFVEDEVMEGEV